MAPKGNRKSKSGGSGPVEDPSKSPQKIQKAIERIQDSILQKMNRKNEQSNQPTAFILEADLKEAWEGHTLQSIFPGWKEDDLQEIRNRYRKTLSILIVINWHGLQDDLFGEEFFGHSDRRDEDLPFVESQCKFLGLGAHLFEVWQHAFMPAIIESYENAHIQIIEPHRRLPFISEGEYMGSGTYGTVWKRSIARGCYHDKSQQLENMLTVS